MEVRYSRVTGTTTPGNHLAFVHLITHVHQHTIMEQVSIVCLRPVGVADDYLVGLAVIFFAYSALGKTFFQPHHHAFTCCQYL